MPAEDAPANPCVVRREGLHAPRKRLRYRGRAGETQALSLVMWQEVRREAEEGAAPQKQESPRVALDLEIAPGRFENGITPFRVRVVKADASGGTASAAQVAQVRRGVGSLRGLGGQGAVAEDGSGAHLQWDGTAKLSPEAQSLAEQVRALLVGTFVPLPPVPMGEGGQWVVGASGETRPGEPEIRETEFACSVIGDGAEISAVASAEATQAVEVPGPRAGTKTVRAKVTTEVRLHLTLLPGQLFPAHTMTRTHAAHYRSGDTAFVDRQSLEFRLRGPDAPEPRKITVTAAGEEPRIPIEYPAALGSRLYAIEYLEHETKAADGRVEKSGQPRVRVVVRCQQWPQSEPRFREGYVMQWTVVDAGVVGDGSRGIDEALRALKDRGGGGALGRSCEAVAGYATDPETESRLRMKRQRMDPVLWLELPDDTSPDVRREAARLCDALEWSMLLVPEKRYEAPAEEDRDPVVIVPRLGKGGEWRYVDELMVPGTKTLKRVVECSIAEIGEESFTVSCRSEDALAALGLAEIEGLPEGTTAELKACTARRTGSWTIAKECALPRRANVEDVLDREYEATDPDGSRKTIRFHTVRAVTIEALD